MSNKAANDLSNTSPSALSNLGAAPNPNLLVNGNFKDNPRGKTAYTEIEETVKGWRNDSGILVEVLAEGVKLTCSAIVGRNFKQIVSLSGDLPQTVTASVLVTDLNGSFRMILGNQSGVIGGDRENIGETGLVSKTFPVPPDSQSLYLQINPTVTGESMTVKAAKLEFGTRQTLAYQDANGDWQLLPQPDFDRPVNELRSRAYAQDGNYLGMIHGLGLSPRRNLLDNWYFVGGGSQQGDGKFPINQRGEARYAGSTATAGVHTVDRWDLYRLDSVDTAGEISIGADGLTVTSDGGGSAYLVQILDPELSAYLSGKTVTLSFLASSVSGTWSFGMYTKTVGTVSASGIVTSTFTWDNKVAVKRIQLYANSAGAKITLTAAKLEEGSTQTLAAQVDGRWVLLDRPDYGETLAKCQRYLQVLGGAATSPIRLQAAHGNQASLFFPMPVSSPMRNGNPTITVPSGATLSVYAGEAQSGFTFSAVNHSNCMTIIASKNSHGLTENKFPMLLAQQVLLSCEL